MRSRGDLVEGGEGLVHEQEAGAGGEGAGDGDAHLLAAGELARVVLGDVSKADEIEEAGGGLVDDVGGAAF